MHDMERILAFSTFLVQPKTLIAMLYIIVAIWIISFILQRSKYKKLLDRCNSLQAENVSHERKCNENEKEITELKAEIQDLKEIMKKEGIEYHDEMRRRET